MLTDQFQPVLRTDDPARKKLSTAPAGVNKTVGPGGVTSYSQGSYSPNLPASGGSPGLQRNPYEVQRGNPVYNPALSGPGAGMVAPQKPAYATDINNRPDMPGLNQAIDPRNPQQAAQLRQMAEKRKAAGAAAQQANGPQFLGYDVPTNAREVGQQLAQGGKDFANLMGTGFGYLAGNYDGGNVFQDAAAATVNTGIDVVAGATGAPDLKKMADDALAPTDLDSIRQQQLIGGRGPSYAKANEIADQNNPLLQTGREMLSNPGDIRPGTPEYAQLYDIPTGQMPAGSPNKANPQQPALKGQSGPGGANVEAIHVNPETGQRETGPVTIDQDTGVITPDRVRIENTIDPVTGRPVKSYSQIGTGTVTLEDVQRQGIGADNPLRFVGKSGGMTAEEAKAETARRVKSFDDQRLQNRLDYLDKIKNTDGRLTPQLQSERDRIIQQQQAAAQSQATVQAAQLERNTELEKERIKANADIESAKAKSGQQQRPLPTSSVKEFNNIGGQRESMKRLNTNFKDEYAGSYIKAFGEIENWAGRTLPGEMFADEGQAQWWQDYAFQANQLRNDLFGSALTATEKAAFEAATIQPGMDPKQVRENLKRQQMAIDQAAARLANSQRANGYSTEAIIGALGFDPFVVQGSEQQDSQQGSLTAPGNTTMPAQFSTDQRTRAQEIGERLAAQNPGMDPEQIAEMINRELGF